MTRINLLPKKERPSPWPEVQYVLLAVSITVVMISLMLAALNYEQLNELEAQLKELNEQKLLLKSTAADMVLAAQKRQAIKLKADLLVKLTKERVSWHSILSHVSDIMPPRVWLTEISARDGESKDDSAGSDTTFIILKGKAVTYPDIADFIEKMEQDERMVNPLLIRAEKVDSFGDSRFEISVGIKKN